MNLDGETNLKAGLGKVTAWLMLARVCQCKERRAADLLSAITDMPEAEALVTCHTLYTHRTWNLTAGRA